MRFDICIKINTISLVRIINLMLPESKYAVISVIKDVSISENSDA